MAITKRDLLQILEGVTDDAVIVTTNDLSEFRPFVAYKYVPVTHIQRSEAELWNGACEYFYDEKSTTFALYLEH